MVVSQRRKYKIRTNKLHKTYLALRIECPYLELFWSVFSCIRTEYGEIRSISLYSVPMRENTDQNNSKYGHFLSSVGSHFFRVRFSNGDNERTPVQFRGDIIFCLNDQIKLVEFCSIKGTVMQIKKSTEKWSLTCFRRFVKISHSNYV